MAHNFPHPMPSGWFALAASAELAAGEVRAARYFNRELVLWRGEDGAPHVMDAYCPHLGAHLGHGGRVEGETLRCPFHGWRFDGEGVCREISYAERIPPSARASAWPVVERNGAVWGWYHPEAHAPFYEIPSVEEFDATDWEEVHRRRWTVRTQIQEMAENGVDGAHFQSVHGAIALPDSEVRIEGTSRVAIQRAPLVTSRGPTTSVITVRNVGLGFSFTRFTGICETTSLNFVVPVDPHTIEFTVVFLQPLDSPAAGVTRAIITDLEKQIGEDIPIWEHKTYRERPLLCDGDGPIAEFRRWCLQFYAEESAS